jgi:DNA excision repair protein ERCC-8
VAPPGGDVVFIPSERDILMCDLLEGKVLKRLRVPGQSVVSIRAGKGERNVKNRVTSLAWREGDVGLFSAHSDGFVRAWMPRTAEDAETEREEEMDVEMEEENDENRRKRQVLEDVYKDLTRSKITFG